MQKHVFYLYFLQKKYKQLIVKVINISVSVSGSYMFL